MEQGLLNVKFPGKKDNLAAYKLGVYYHNGEIKIYCVQQVLDKIQGHFWLALRSSSDNFETIKFKIEISPETFVRNDYFDTKQVNNDLYFGRLIDSTRGEIVKFNLQSLDEKDPQTSLVKEFQLREELQPVMGFYFLDQSWDVQ